jgi:hypothetical protein
MKWFWRFSSYDGVRLDQLVYWKVTYTLENGVDLRVALLEVGTEKL